MPSALLLLGLFLITACAPQPPTGADRFGDAVRSNMALHVIEPAPRGFGEAPADGSRRVLMIERYRTDQVVPPLDVTSVQR
ncbi:MAG TPA: hypothetical protein VFG43_09080 [Geminicoccaceae bacterium]|nr:hypothetical protein [Geminicoccaceae bacterium]